MLANQRTNSYTYKNVNEISWWEISNDDDNTHIYYLYYSSYTLLSDTCCIYVHVDRWMCVCICFYILFFINLFFLAFFFFSSSSSSSSFSAVFFVQFLSMLLLLLCVAVPFWIDFFLLVVAYACIRYESNLITCFLFKVHVVNVKLIDDDIEWAWQTIQCIYVVWSYRWQWNCTHKTETTFDANERCATE